MNPEKIWIAILILVLVLVGSNLLMFAIARGARSSRLDIGKSLQDFTKPWKKEDERLAELSQRVKELQANQKDAGEE